jgi:hypothetical protein
VAWVLDEDDALKTKLSNFTVVNPADMSQVPVPVYFRFPDTEERTRTFPHIAIDLFNVAFDPTRAHRAMEYRLTFDTETATPAQGYTLVADDYPLPWILQYQLGVYSRNPRHDRQLMLMLYQMFPETYGSLDMSAFDGTIRRADLVSVVRRDTVDSAGKRQYHFIMTINISSEFFLNQIKSICDVRSVDFTLVEYFNQPAVA